MILIFVSVGMNDSTNHHHHHDLDNHPTLFHILYHMVGGENIHHDIIRVVADLPYNKQNVERKKIDGMEQKKVKISRGLNYLLKKTKNFSLKGFTITF